VLIKYADALIKCAGPGGRADQIRLQ